MTPKQIWDLKLSDLRECPIWAYLSEGQPGARDECTLAPCSPDAFDFETMYVALATFELACGRSYLGYVHPESALGHSQPCMFVAGSAITFWNGMHHPTSESLAEAYGLMDLSASEVFPIRWRTDYSCEPELSSGTIEGFGYVGDDGDCFVT